MSSIGTHFTEFVYRISLTRFSVDVFQQIMLKEDFNYPVWKMPSGWLNKNAQFVEVREKLLFLTPNALFAMELVNILKLQTAI
jgi:hypothetical protein